MVLSTSGGGGGDKKTTPTIARTTTTTTETTTTPAAGKDEQDIQLALTTTLKAARQGDELVFCGGLSPEYEKATFGGAIECQEKAKKGQIPKEFVSASDASSNTEVNGDRATVLTVDGATFEFVRGESFWQIDGVG